VTNPAKSGSSGKQARKFTPGRETFGGSEYGGPIFESRVRNENIDSARELEVILAIAEKSGATYRLPSGTRCGVPR